MALSPTIPTSFVPKQPVSPNSRHYSSGNNIFLYVSLVILVISIVLAGGVFFYSAYLTSVENAKGAELLAAQQKVSPSAVDDFIRLHDRFIAASSVMNQHIALSQFFNLLGSITVQNVSFTSLQIQVADDRSAQLTMIGNAKNFNALAAESTAFAQQKEITSAIFSGITVNKDGTVGFSLAANLKPSIVIEKTAPSTPALLPAPSTTATTPSSFAAPTTQTASSTTSTSGATSQASVPATSAAATPPASTASSSTP